VEVGVAFGLVPCGGSGAAGEKDGEGFAFLVLGLAAAGVAENAAHFEETQGFLLLADVSRGGGDESGHDARAHDGVVLAEREFHADDIAVLQRAQRQGVGELMVGDEFDRLAFIDAESGEAAAQDHVGIVGGIDGLAGTKEPEQARGHIRKAVDAGDFLDEVDVALEVGAERGDSMCRRRVFPGRGG
jgi:hypothetical protein